jgi:hypothetical protein
MKFFCALNRQPEVFGELIHTISPLSSIAATQSERLHFLSSLSFTQSSGARSYFQKYHPSAGRLTTAMAAAVI